MNIQISISSHGTEERDIKDKLRDWHRLEKRRQQLERIIPEQEKRLADLKDKLTASSILSSIIQQTEHMDMPRGSGTSDRVGDLVANTLDKVAELEARVQEWRLELAQIYAELADIEYYVYQLKPTYQEVVIRVYRDGWSQQQVAEAMHFSRSMVDKMVRKSIKSMKGW